MPGPRRSATGQRTRSRYRSSGGVTVAPSTTCGGSTPLAVRLFRGLWYFHVIVVYYLHPHACLGALTLYTGL